jgi:ParB-like chromosome segregation protein Spo0J
MIVSLASLKPNSLRDFRVDPISEASVQRLMQSITEDGFWGGVVCRPVDGAIEIVAGHHRVEAARRCGVTEADLFIKAMDDDTALRIYARENATQRGMTESTARAGTTAAVLRDRAYKFLAWDLCAITQRWPGLTEKALETIQGNLANGGGLGRPVILEALEGVPGINTQTIRDDLASLKSSGHYARILDEVRQQITAEREEAERQVEAARRAAEEELEAREQQAAREAEQAREREAEAARKAEAKARKAAEQAAKTAATFNFDAVAPHFKNPHQLKVFRDTVTRPPWTTFLPLEEQGKIAAQIVARAAAQETEPDGYFIRMMFAELATQLFHGQGDKSEAENEEAALLVWQRQYSEQQNTFMSSLRGAILQGRRLLSVVEETKLPPGGCLSPTPRFVIEIAEAEALLKEIKKRYGTKIIDSEPASERTLEEPWGSDGEPIPRPGLCPIGA